MSQAFLQWATWTVNSQRTLNNCWKFSTLKDPQLGKMTNDRAGINRCSSAQTSSNLPTGYHHLHPSPTILIHHDSSSTGWLVFEAPKKLEIKDLNITRIRQCRIGVMNIYSGSILSGSGYICILDFHFLRCFKQKLADSAAGMMNGNGGWRMETVDGNGGWPAVRLFCSTLIMSRTWVSWTDRGKTICQSLHAESHLGSSWKTTRCLRKSIWGNEMKPLLSRKLCWNRLNISRPTIVWYYILSTL